ncbi:tetratricopeptide repeat protein [Streptomyces sp. B1866]|uniref:tetratricopeptide repeat protein n=1 Tax=Streptomyces sp. B1866 TaxID=3075431 RepID=UPI00288F97D7|nr:tetratricopeptide repeat protein [Streptomyces sp. B1866]MDT3395916.1 tetratricopeptide repeat protein [Streptomyces sp. B1866]
MSNAISGTVRGPSLQAAMIHGDVYLGAPAAPRPVAPRQLPPAPRHFTGRGDDLAALDALRRPGQPAMAVVTGPAGVGKTALALRWLHEHSDDYPDGQLYVDLGGHDADDPVAPSTVLPWFLRALGVPTGEVPVDLAEQAALYRTVTAGLRVAVLCDNALSAAQVRPLAPASPRGVCLVTSRWRLTSLLLDGADLLPVEPLDTDAAVDLLGRIAGRDRIASERRAARDLVTSLGRFPLAVCVGAALLLTRPGWSVASAAAGFTALRSAVPGEEVSMTASLDQSYAALPADAACLYRRLGLHPGTEFSADLAREAALTEPPVQRVGDCLTALTEANLLTAPGPERHRFHDLIRRHARDRAEADETPAQRQETVQRITDHYLASAYAADKVLYPQRQRPVKVYESIARHPVDCPTPAAALQWFDSERHNLLAVQRLAADEGLHAQSWQLADALWGLFVFLRYHPDWIAAYELGVTSARACGHRLAEARLRTGLGVAFRDTGRYDAALAEFEAAIALRREIGDRRGEAVGLHNVALTHRERGDLDRARETLRAALALREEAGDRRGVAREHTTLGEVASLAGDHPAAVAHLTRARDELAGTGDPFAVLAERLLGEAHLRAGHETAAEAHLTAALELSAETGQGLFEEARIHETLGELAERRRDRDAAADRYARAEDIYTGLAAAADARRAAARRRRLDPEPGG